MLAKTEAAIQLPSTVLFCPSRSFVRALRSSTQAAGVHFIYSAALLREKLMLEIHSGVVLCAKVGPFHGKTAIRY